MDGPIADEFTEAAAWLAELAAQIPDAAWEQPGLGVWDIRSLLGHAARALATVEDYLSRPAAQIDVPSAVAYLAAAASASPEAIAARGVAAGDALGEDPATSVAELAARATSLVVASPADALLATIAGGMSLEAYLPTRTVELVVHGCDLAQALGLPDQPPDAASAAASRLLVEVQLATTERSRLCLVLAGRPLVERDLTIWSGSTSSRD
jgi:uncharacterized protein (TIGR03083 family)